MDRNVALSKVYFLILIRFLLLISSMIVLFIQRSASLPNLFALNESKLLVGYLVINAIYILTAHFFYMKVGLFLLIQIAMDLFVITGLVYLTGGILSMYLSVYFGPIIAAGMLIHPTLGFLYASLATIGIAGVSLVYFLASLTNVRLPWISEQVIYPSLEHDFSFLRAYLFAQGLSFHLVALFVHWLSGVMSRQRILHDEILHNLLDGVLVMDKKQVVLFMNTTAKKMFSISENESCANRQLHDIISSQKYGNILVHLDKQIYLRVETEIDYTEGIVPIVLTITPFATKKQVNAYIVILHDIRDQKRMQEALKRVQRLQTISEVASSISHEIRNPLASIRGAIQELRNNYPENDEKYLLMDIALKESDRLNRIVGDFLHFSKVRPSNLVDISLNHILEEFVFFLKKRPDMLQSEITLNIQGNLDVLGDSEQLKQVFYNLATNALEAAEEEGLKLTITAEPCPAKDFLSNQNYSFYNAETMGVRILFIDQGRGINPQHYNKIFSPFFTTKENGTGMGLAMVSKILDMHQGLYQFSSVTGQGTIFSIWLPRQQRSGEMKNGML